MKHFEARWRAVLLFCYVKTVRRRREYNYSNKSDKYYCSHHVNITTIYKNYFVLIREINRNIRI